MHTTFHRLLAMIAALCVVASACGSDDSEAEAADAEAGEAATGTSTGDEAAQNWYRPVGARQLAHRADDAGGPYRPAEIGAFLADLALRGLLVDPSQLDTIRAVTVADSDTRAPEAG